MNITMNSASLPQASASTPGEAAVNTVAPGEALPLDPALAATQPGAGAPLAFLQFMQVDAALPDVAAQPALDGAALDAALDTTLDAATGAVLPAADVQDEATQAVGDNAAQPQLAAMSMPLMPSMMAMPAALSAVMRLAGMPERQERASAAVSSAAGANTGDGAGASAGTTAGTSAGAIELPLAAAQPALDRAVTQAARAAVTAQPAQQVQAAAPQAVPVELAGADRQGAASHAAQGADAGFGIAAPSTPAAPAASRDGSTLSLSGPPTAWRQSLQEALGDRLNLQLTKNAEQAVIRLDPPMLGRVEISIRHAAGSLEVNITATHSEVLRQLNTVSDNLRNDLAGRQYADVSVNVSQAPRAQAAQAGAGFGADAQGRGRQQGQDQDQDGRAPGAALAEANHSTTAFSLNGRA